MKIIIGLLVAAALGLITNLVSTFLAPKAEKRKKLVWGIFAALIGLSIVLALMHESVVKPLPLGVDGLTILKPHKDDKVGQYVDVHGFSSFLREPHYLIVTSQNPAQRYVVSGPFVPASDGSWEATARLGSGLEGYGQTFQIQVLSTQTALAEGSLSENPPGSPVSPAVSVFRNK